MRREEPLQPQNKTIPKSLTTISNRVQHRAVVQHFRAIHSIDGEERNHLVDNDQGQNRVQTCIKYRDPARCPPSAQISHSSATTHQTPGPISRSAEFPLAEHQTGPGRTFWQSAHPHRRERQTHTVVLTIEAYERIADLVEEADDVLEVERRMQDADFLSLAEVKTSLGLHDPD